MVISALPVATREIDLETLLTAPVAAAASVVEAAAFAALAETSATNAQASSRTAATWTALAALTGTVAGEGAEVLDADAGTHTDPVIGGTVANAGRYTWSASPAGWKWIGATGLAGKVSTEFVDTSRPRYLNRKAIVSVVVGSSMAAISGAYLDATAFTYKSEIAVANGLTSANGALSFGASEGSFPLGQGTIENARPRYDQRRQVVTANVSTTFAVISATYLDGTSYGQTAAEATKLPLVVLGDSLGDFMIAELATETGRTIIDLAIGGQVHFQIYNRFIGFTARSSTNTIASGSNSITHINGVAISGAATSDEHMVLSTAADTTTRTLTGTLGSIRGSLQRAVVSAVETYTFTPDGGQTLPVTLPADSPFIPDTRDYLLYPHVWSIGRNGSWTDGKSADVIQRLLHIMPHRNICVMDVPNGNGNVPNEYGPAGSLYLQIQAINRLIQQVAGPCFVPVSRILKDRGLALAGLAPNVQDATDTANDVESNQLRADAIHRNTTGDTVIARHILQPILTEFA